MPINWRVWNRKSHRWGAAVVAVPFLVVLVTGILLQIKKDWSWVQPPTQRSSGPPSISLETLLSAAQGDPVTEIAGWGDVERIDIRPNRGIAKVVARNNWEVQISLSTGEVLQVAYRRSDIIESLHDGSWFGSRAKLWVFLPSAVVVLGLWITGVYLFLLPLRVRWKQRRNLRR